MGSSIDKKIYLTNIVLVTLFACVIFFLLYINVQQQKHATVEFAKAKTASLSKFITTDIDRIIYGVEEIIEGLHHADNHISNHATHDKELTLLLKETLRPYMSNILIADKNANIIHWTQSKEKPDISDREYINYHLQKNKSHKLFIGTPKRSKVNPENCFFAISKAFYKNGKVDKIIVVTLNLDFFYQRYKENLFNENATILMASTDGTLYVRYPMAKKYIGKKVSEITDFGKSKKELQHFDIISPIDQKPRIATLVHSMNYSMVAGVSILKEDVMADWNEYKKNTILLSIIIAVGFLIVIIYYTQLQRRLIILTQTDSLTQLLNRAHFTKEAKKEFARAKRYGDNLSVIMLDIDNFKTINDTFGHQAGDKVIKQLAKDINSNIRHFDYASRYGGEEFIILLVKTTHEGANKVALRIKEAFEQSKCLKNHITTSSFGISHLSFSDDSIEDIIQRADKALYVSKNAGKNCITTK